MMLFNYILATMDRREKTMILDTTTVTSKTGKEFQLVSIGPDDAERFLDFMHQVSCDTHFMSRYGDEVKQDDAAIQAEKTRLKTLQDSDIQGMFSIIDGDRIIGNIAIRQVCNHRKTAHRCNIGLGIRKEYHGFGLGTILVDHAINFAKNSGYKIMELGVLSDNIKAQGLYKKMGFTEWGRLPEAFFLDDGTPIDEITMYRKL